MEFLHVTNPRFQFMGSFGRLRICRFKHFKIKDDETQGEGISNNILRT